MSSETPSDSADNQEAVQSKAIKVLEDFEKKFPDEKLKSLEEDGTMDRTLKGKVFTARAQLTNLKYMDLEEDFDVKRAKEAIAVLENFMKPEVDKEAVQSKAIKVLEYFEKKFPNEKLKSLEEDGAIDKRSKLKVSTAVVQLNNMKYLVESGEDFNVKAAEEAIEALENFMKKVRKEELARLAKEDEKDTSSAIENLEKFVEGNKPPQIEVMEKFGFRCTSLGEPNARDYDTFWEIQHPNGAKAYLSLTGPLDLSRPVHLFKNRNKQGKFFALIGVGDPTSIAIAITSRIHSFNTDNPYFYFEHSTAHETDTINLSRPEQIWKEKFDTIERDLRDATKYLQWNERDDQWEYNFNDFLSRTSAVREELLAKAIPACEDYLQKLKLVVEHRNFPNLTGGQSLNTRMYNGVLFYLERIIHVTQSRTEIGKTLKRLHEFEIVSRVKNELDEIAVTNPVNERDGTVYWEKTSSPHIYDVVKKSNSKYRTIGNIRLRSDSKTPIEVNMNDASRSKKVSSVRDVNDILTKSR